MEEGDLSLDSSRTMTRHVEHAGCSGSGRRRDIGVESPRRLGGAPAAERQNANPTLWAAEADYWRAGLLLNGKAFGGRHEQIALGTSIDGDGRLLVEAVRSCPAAAVSGRSERS
jgi:hypothetical protein